MHGTREGSKQPRRAITSDDLDLVERKARMEAYDSFWAYRQYMRPRMLRGWWQREIAAYLEQFYVDWMLGKRPVLIIQAPPQHGKSDQVTDFISWASGRNPSLNTIYASYSDDLGVKANMKLQRTIDSPRYSNIFAETRISASNVVTSGRWLRNSSMMEFIDKTGSFRNTTVMGQITGMGLDLGVVDDPIKGRAEASSPTVRDKTWAWFTDDFFSRFSEQGALLIIMTRWHLDDPVGRFIERYTNARVLRYPAIATHDEQYRRKGDALFPQLKSLDFLMQRKRVLTASSFESLYQQNPIVVGGGLFPLEKVDVLPARPNRGDVRSAVRYWDKAGTKDGGAYTAGVLMFNMADESFVVADVRRGQWSALDRERVIKQTAEIDATLGVKLEIYVEQEPGSGGKESAERTIRMLRGHTVLQDRVTGDKETRAEPYAAQFQAGNVKLVAAPWNRDFLDEHEQFPSGKYKDQVDAAGGAFMKLAVPACDYDTTMAWVGGEGIL